MLKTQTQETEHYQVLLAACRNTRDRLVKKNETQALNMTEMLILESAFEALAVIE